MFWYDVNVSGKRVRGMKRGVLIYRVFMDQFALFKSCDLLGRYWAVLSSIVRMDLNRSILK